MSTPNLCTNCRALPPTVFCTTDLAFLCTSCDLTIQATTKSPRPRIRIPLQPSTRRDAPIPDFSDVSSDLLLVPDVDPTTTSTSLSHTLLSTLSPHQHQPTNSDIDVLTSVLTSPNPTSDAAYSSSCSSTPTPVKHDEISPVTTSSNEWIPHVPDAAQQRLASMANVYVKQEARALYESSRRGPVTDVVSSMVTGVGRVVKDVSTVGMQRTPEQRRIERAAALKRFREKRANRRFGKRVRYACRKQLADSRPRVKGRFVGRGEGGRA